MSNQDLVSDSTWNASERRSLHPLSLMFELITLVRRNILPTIFAVFSAAQGGPIGLIIGSIVCGIALLTAIVRYVTFRYRIVDSELVIDQGLIFRKHTTVPVGRIQNIDMVQNLLHRLFGVGEVRVETGSGTEPEAVMRVLAVSELDRLRGVVFSHRRMNEGQTQEQAEAASATKVSEPSELVGVDPAEHLVSGELVHRLSVRQLFWAGLASNRGMVFASILVGLVWQSKIGDKWLGRNFDTWVTTSAPSRETVRTAFRRGDLIRNIWSWANETLGPNNMIVAAVVLLLVVTVLLRLLSAIWYVVRFYGYELELRGNELKVRCGLMTKVSATVPRDRIQLISIHRSWLARRMGFAEVRIETAGGGKSEEDAATTVGRRWFIPVIAEADIPRVMPILRPGMVWEPSQWEWRPLSKLAPKRIMRFWGMVSAVVFVVGLIYRPYWGWGIGLLGFVGAYWYAQKKAKSRRYMRTDWGILFRGGILYQKCSVTFADKIQCIEYRQSPFDRRWGMAALSIDTSAAGPAEHQIAIELLDAQFADTEFNDLARVAAANRIKWRTKSDMAGTRVESPTASNSTSARDELLDEYRVQIG